MTDIRHAHARQLLLALDKGSQGRRAGAQDRDRNRERGRRIRIRSDCGCLFTFNSALKRCARSKGPYVNGIIMQIAGQVQSRQKATHTRT